MLSRVSVSFSVSVSVFAAVTSVWIGIASSMQALGAAAEERDEQLAGDWFTDCYRRGGSSRRDAISFSEGRVRYNRAYFDNLACTQPVFEYVIGGTYELGIAALAGASALDVTVDSADIIIYDPWLAMSFRDQRYCGHSYWPANTLLPILGDVCGEETEPQYFAGQVRRDLIRVDATSHVPRLYFGEPSALFGDGAAGLRADGLDFDRAFKKDVP